jgi:hypothetical protein
MIFWPYLTRILSAQENHRSDGFKAETCMKLGLVYLYSPYCVIQYPMRKLDLRDVYFGLRRPHEISVPEV